MPHKQPLKEQFWAHVERGADDDCWEWKASRRATGYGQMCRAPLTLKAHRVSWEIHNGAIPAGMCVMHKCDNPPCVNPAHLRLGTQTANLRDMQQKARGSGGSKIGTANPAAKLTEAQVITLRDRAAAGTAIRALSREFGLDKKTVTAIVRRETWRHI